MKSKLAAVPIPPSEASSPSSSLAYPAGGLRAGGWVLRLAFRTQDVPSENTLARSGRNRPEKQGKDGGKGAGREGGEEGGTRKELAR